MLDATVFAREVAAALDAEFGSRPHKVKEVARLTGCNERTVKNWFQARNGPSGECLVTLMRHSDQVLRLVLRCAEREDLLDIINVTEAKARLAEAVSTLDGLLNPNEEGF
ncbi:homeobox domain-containing protein [Methylobacterium radiodurans]|uniref:homeobox domain-containing protein n=1 Tax=Methylobacterium radiodurans TaxID=2202828 RepID=UPI0013A5738E|nr:homeobox domain-containing protein [Methylobacterium radiodurans]